MQITFGLSSQMTFTEPDTQEMLREGKKLIRIKTFTRNYIDHSFSSVGAMKWSGE